MAKDLTALFCPKSVAIVGASRTPEKVGAIVLKNIISSGFTGKIYPVNPNADQIGALACFKDMASLPEVPDLAVIAIPVPGALEALTQVGEKGIKNAVIFSAGFKEIGAEGKKLEDELISIAQRYNINVLGPNCLGFVNNLCPINVTFGEAAKESGNLRFISQSGAIASSLFDWCKSNGLSFSEFVTLGNKAVINENDILEYFQNSKTPVTGHLPKVQPIGLYLESISQGAEFLKLTGEITKTDPIFILKPGKTKAAAKAMQSHTGAIAGEDAVLEAVLVQSGVIRCQTLEDFFDLSRSFAWKESPSGPRVAIISNAGGPAVISADAVTTEGLELAEFDAQTHEKLLEVLPRSAAILNPVDVLGDALAKRYLQASEIILQNDQVNALIVILTPQIMTQICKTATALGDLSQKYQKPIFCSFIGGSLVAEGEQKLNEYKIPSFRFPERAIRAVAQMWKFKEHQAEQVENVPAQPVDFQIDLKKVLQKPPDSFQINEFLQSAGFFAPPMGRVSSLEQAKDFAKQFGYPVVLKLSSPGLLHKKKIGGVITGIENDVQLESAGYKISQAAVRLQQETGQAVAIQIQKEVGPGVEVIIGIKQDPTFGPVLLFGAGGSFAELIADRNLHLLPMNIAQAKKLVQQAKIFSALSGSNGDPVYSLDKLLETIIRLGQLAVKYPEIREIEINPVIVTLDNVWAVDGKVIL